MGFCGLGAESSSATYKHVRLGKFLTLSEPLVHHLQNTDDVHLEGLLG